MYCGILSSYHLAFVTEAFFSEKNSLKETFFSVTEMFSCDKILDRNLFLPELWDGNLFSEENCFSDIHFGLIATFFWDINFFI